VQQADLEANPGLDLLAALAAMAQKVAATRPVQSLQVQSLAVSAGSLFFSFSYGYSFVGIGDELLAAPLASLATTLRQISAPQATRRPTCHSGTDLYQLVS
jgi:hypothetical protein